MKVFNKKILIGMIIFFTLFSVFAGGKSEEKSDGASGDVILYSSNKQAAIDLVAKMFKNKYPEMNISIVRAGSGALMKRIDAEKGNPQADVFWSGGFGTLGAYKDSFAEYKSDEAKVLEKEFVEKENLWTGVNVHPMVIMYNSKLIDKKDLPKTWSDLFDPKYKDMVVMGDPVKSSSTYAQAYGIYKKFGEDGLKKLIPNVTNVPSTSMVYKGVAAGEYALGITMEYAAYAYVAGGQDEIGLIYPEDGTFLSPEGVVLIKNGPNPEGAKMLYDFLCGSDVQTALFVKSYRRPLRNDIPVKLLTGTDLPAFEDINVFPVDQAEAAEMRGEFSELWHKLTTEN